MPFTLTAEQQRIVLRLGKLGWDWKRIARAAGCSTDAARWVRPHEQRKAFPWTPGPGRLTFADREEITIGLAKGENLSCIARRIAKSPSCVSREVANNGGPQGYRAWLAHQGACVRARRPKAAKLSHPPLCALVAGWLEEFWSPDEIAGVCAAPSPTIR